MTDLPEPVCAIYHSANFLAINKDCDIPVNSDDVDRVTVATQLSRAFPELVDSSVKHAFRFTHRLDYATSGVLCLSLNKKAARKLHHAFASRLVLKHYLALVRGHMDNNEVIVEEPIGRDSSVDFHRMKVGSSPACEDARPARSTLVRLETGSYEGQPATKLLLLPHTGRTHQLRVHCAHTGHPIVGDYTYSNRTDTSPHRMMLHAYRLMTDTGLERLDLTAPDPFLTAVDPLWKPHSIHASYAEYVAHLPSL